MSWLFLNRARDGNAFYISTATVSRYVFQGRQVRMSLRGRGISQHPARKRHEQGASFLLKIPSASFRDTVVSISLSALSVLSACHGMDTLSVGSRSEKLDSLVSCDVIVITR